MLSFLVLFSQILEQLSSHGMRLILKFLNPWKWWNPKNLLGTMFRIFTFVTPYWSKVRLNLWFGLGVLGCTSENLGFWVKERLGQICGLFERVLVVRIRVLGQEGNIRVNLVLFEGVLDCRIQFMKYKYEFSKLLVFMFLIEDPKPQVN